MRIARKTLQSRKPNMDDIIKKIFPMFKKMKGYKNNK